METPVNIRWVTAMCLSLLAALALSAVAAGAAHAEEKAPRVEVKEGGVFKPLGIKEKKEEKEEIIIVRETKEFTGESTSVGVLEVPGLGLTLENPAGGCTASGTLLGSEEGKPTTASGGELICEEVKVKEFPQCTVHSVYEVEGEEVESEDGTVEAGNLGGKAVWLEETGEKVGILFEPNPETGEFTDIIVEKNSEPGSGCGVSTEAPVEGEVIGKVFGEGGVEETCNGAGFENGELKLSVPPILTWWTNGWNGVNEEPEREEKEIEQLKVGNKPATLEVDATFHLVPEQPAKVCGS